MKSFVVFALFIAAALAAPQYTKDADVQVLKQTSDVQPDGYSYEYALSNGASAQEQGQLKNAGSEAEALEVRGQFSYPGPDGQVYTVQYIANENGFQPQGAHLPQAP